MALVSVSINMLLPAFYDITLDFHLIDKNQIQLSISLLYLGLGISQLFYGSLSDSIGRKHTIYLGLALFILGSIVSFQSSNFHTLLTGQLVQGIGLGAPRVMSIAIVRDNFDGNQMARAVSFIMAIYVVTPSLSPILGKLIIDASNWRILYIVYIILAMITILQFKNRMPETLAQEKKKCFTLNHVINSTKEVFQNTTSMSFIVILGLYSGVFITYLNLSQAIFEFQFQLEHHYPYYFAFLALSIGLASFINGHLVNRLGMRRLTLAALINSILVVVFFLIFDYLITSSFWIFIAFMFAQLFGYGILIGNLSALAMQPLGHIAGLGASIIGAVSTLISVPLSVFIGYFYVDSVLPIVIGFFIVSILSLIIFHSLHTYNK